MIKIPVEDMPQDFSEACLELGHDEGDELSPQQAIRLWSQWHLGDPYWGGRVLTFLEEVDAKSGRACPQD